MEGIRDAGGYSEFRKLTREEQLIFDQALEGLVGAGYTPLLVSTQVVAGLNYRFYCDAVGITNPPMYFNAYVYVFRSLEGEIKLTKIARVVEENIEESAI